MIHWEENNNSDSRKFMFQCCDNIPEKHDSKKNCPFLIMNQVQLKIGVWGFSNLCDLDTVDTLHISNACNQLSLFDF